MDTPAPAGRLTLAPPAATVAFRHLTALWVQITGTLCNLQCVHCINASGPREPWLAPLGADTARRYIAEAAALGVKEIYFTGGEPFMHPEILPLLAFSLERAPTTVLTNGTLIDEAMADALAALARRASYSLEIRVSLDDTSPETNDRVRGAGSFSKAVAAIVTAVSPVESRTASAAMTSDCASSWIATVSGEANSGSRTNSPRWRSATAMRRPRLVARL